MIRDSARTIRSVDALGQQQLRVEWSDGIVVNLDIPQGRGTVEPSDWGHSLVWEDGTELSADTLWLGTLTAIGRDDARQFLEWRLSNALSLARAAEELGLSRRTVAYYSNGTRAVPKAILLACKGWDATHPTRKAA